MQWSYVTKKSTEMLWSFTYKQVMKVSPNYETLLANCYNVWHSLVSFCKEPFQVSSVGEQKNS